MNIETGQLIEGSAFKKLVLADCAAAKQFINVRRDLSKHELADMQIRLYSPCACGSGKKLKFCCYKPAML